MNQRAYRRARMAESTEEQIPTALGVWCMIHSAYDCAEPSCWRCGNHTIENEICSDPRCGATNNELVRHLWEDYKRIMAVPRPPREVVAYLLGQQMAEVYLRVSQAGRDGTGPGERVMPSPAPLPFEVE